MLSVNTISLVAIELTTAEADPIGPVEAVVLIGDQRLRLTFLSPVSCWHREGNKLGKLGQGGDSKEFFGYTRTPGCMAHLELWTHCDQGVQNGAQTWYAFSCRAELNMAKQMVKADGVGMKTVVTTMAKAGPGLLDAVSSGDRERAKALPGMGGKTGEKMLAELFKGRPATSSPAAPLDKNAIMALQALGYKAEPSRKAVTAAQQELPAGSDTPTIVTKALSLLQS
jgi:Holliday junction DNA helicase RuvA